MQGDRLFEIIYILLERKTISAKALSERLEVSTKTIYRDIDRLSQAGMPIYTSKGKGGGISILPNFVMDKAVLSQDEKLSIQSALSAFEKLDPNGMANGISKLKAFFGDIPADWIEVDFSSWSNPDKERQIFNTMKKSILTKQLISFSYSNARGERTKRFVEPLKLAFKGQAWYLYGYCRTRETNRFFKLTRIKDLSVEAKQFIRTTPTRIFTEGNIYSEEFTTVRLKLSSEMAYRVYDEFENVEELTDGKFIVEMKYPKGTMLFSYIASFDDGCEIISPSVLKKEYVNWLKKILNIHL